MHRVHREVEVPYSPAQVYALASDVESYPLFLPWCEAMQVQVEDTHVIRAVVTMKLSFMRFRLVTRNRHEPGRSIRMELISGPFRHLVGGWDFEARGTGCRASFNISYEFGRIPLRKPLEAAFRRIADTLLDAFVERARHLYG